MAQILLVEDGVETQIIVRQSLEKLGVISIAPTLLDAHHLIENISFDLILLDVNLPDGDGYRLCTYLKQQDRYAHTPILFLTGHTEIEDKVMAFSLGADDHITKPFHPVELRARVEAKLKKKKSNLNEARQISVGHLRVDLMSHAVYVKTAQGERHLDLTPTGFKLLVHFLSHTGRVFQRESLIEAAWGNAHVLDRTVDSHVSQLRKKLTESGLHLRSVHGVGYVMELSAPADTLKVYKAS